MKTVWFRFISIFVGVGFLHQMSYYLLDPTVKSNTLIPSYIIQGAVGLLVLFLIFSTVKKYSNALAFLFMGLSLVKILLFFLVFLPLLKADGNLSGVEKLDVLVPYFTTLGLEAFFGVKKLNKI